MGRRTSGQQVGLQAIGLVQANAATLTTTQPNADLTLDPNGTGAVQVNASLTVADNLNVANHGDLRLFEATGNGSNYLAQQASSSMAVNYTLTWPPAVSTTNGFVLTTDTGGNLTWASAGGNIGVSDPGSSSTLHYLFFGTNAGALPSTLTPLVRNNITFVPSTGELTATALNAANHYGSNSNSGTMTLRGTTAATKATASVLMTDGVVSNSTTTGTLVVTGGIGVSGQITATTLVETSSITLKENINPISNALDLISQLLGVTYDRKDNKQHEAGLIAEDVYKVLPDLVSLDKNGQPYGVKYTKLSVYLLESIKSLQQEIEKLKTNR